MKRLLFDLETNGLLSTPWDTRKDPVSKIHCGVVVDVDPAVTVPQSYTIKDGNVDALLAKLDEADVLIGHNIMEYDLPVLKKLVGWTPRPEVEFIDTTIWSRMAFPIWRIIKLDKHLKVDTSYCRHRHSLESWGIRLGYLKGDFGKDNDWSTFTPEMLEYCVRDVKVNAKLVSWLTERSGYSVESAMLESACAGILYRQRLNGVKLDHDGAIALTVKLQARRDVHGDQLKETFPPWYVPDGKPFVPKRNNRTLGYAKGCEVQKIKLQELKPGSRFHVAKCLKELHGWEPSEYNDDGSAKVNRSILRDLPYPEAHAFADWEELNKKVGMVCEGKEAWLKQSDADSLLHGKVTVSGAKTGRCTHSNPNLAQVPKVGKPWGEDCRALFGPTRDGWKMLGCDASGLELRVLAHYMGRWDGGEFAKLVTEGDVHSAFMEGTGINIRDNQKTFTYAMLYGAGLKKLGTIVWFDIQLAGGTPPPYKHGKLIELGKRARAGLETRFPALANLQFTLKAAKQRDGYVKLPDGRRVYLESDHSALNMLCQGAGAIVMKKALVNLDGALREIGWRPGVDYEFMLNVHDEYQLEVHPDHTEAIALHASNAIRCAGQDYNLRVALDAESKVGDNWAETH